MQLMENQSQATWTALTQALEDNGKGELTKHQQNLTSYTIYSVIAEGR